MRIPTRYLALGDSFTIGTGTTPDRSFPAVLVSLWRDVGVTVELLNPAVNGYTTDDLIREELALAGSVAPDFATLLIGANDIVAGSDERRYRAQLRRVYESLADTASLRSQGRADGLGATSSRSCASRDGEGSSPPMACTLPPLRTPSGPPRSPKLCVKYAPPPGSPRR